MNDFNKQKLRISEALIDFCPFIKINGTADGVVLPESLQQESIVLRIGRDPRVLGMPDLVIDDKGFRATISMRGSLFFVDIPWNAVSAMWVHEPFIGPSVAWPNLEDVEERVEEPKKEKTKSFLKLV